MENTFNLNIRRLRKEKGLTQEQLAEAVGISPQAVSKWELSSFPDASLLPEIADALGVTIDELFGRHQEKKDIYNTLLNYFHQISWEQRFQEGFEIFRTLPLSFCGVRAYDPLPESIREGKGWDNHSEVATEEGFLQSRNTGDLQYFLIIPEPEDGYDSVLAYDEDMVKLFAFLVIPNALRTMYFLAGSKKNMFFQVTTLMHELDIDKENASCIIEGMLDLKFIEEATLNSGQDTEKIYQYQCDGNFVSFMIFVRTLLNKPRGFSYQITNRSAPYFKNSTYKNVKKVSNQRDEDDTI